MDYIESNATYLKLLLHLSQQCALITDQASFAGLSGVDAVDTDGKSNREILEEKCGSFLAVLELAMGHGLIDPVRLFRGTQATHARLSTVFSLSEKERHSLRRFLLTG